MLKKKTKINCSVFLFMLIASIIIVDSFGITCATVTSNEALVHVDPPTVTNIMPPSEFNISVKITNVTSLYGLDIEFRWNPTILEYVSHIMKVPVETYPDGVLHQPSMTIKNEVNATAGKYWVAASSMYPAPEFNGTGIVFTMTLRVKAIGRCLLQIYTSDLSDINGNPITHQVQNGYFTNFVPPSAKIYVNPKQIIDTTLVPCSNFTIEIVLENIVDLSNFTFLLGYNTSTLDAPQVTLNPIFPPPYEIEINETEGKIRVAASISPPLTGNLILVWVTFHVANAGESILDLHGVSLVDVWNETIPYQEPIDGYFSNMLITRMFVSPPELIDPTMKPGDIFTIDIKIENAIDMYGYKFKLAYDTSVLTCLGAVVIPPNEETSFVVWLLINDTEGLMKVEVQYNPPALPFSIYSPKTVVTITFLIQAYGSTELDLHDTDITDQYGNPISHEVGDGFFAILLRDVAIIDVNVTSPNKVYPGRIVTIDVVAMNKGNMTIEVFNVTAYYGSNPIGTIPVILEPWTNITLTFYWNTSGLTPCNNFTIWAEASQVPYEIDIENNELHDGWVKIKRIGDVDGDGIVNLYDVVIACSAYATREGDPNWNPEADIAPPWGLINIYDIVTIISHYEKTC